MGSLAATHKPAIRQPFGPFPPTSSSPASTTQRVRARAVGRGKAAAAAAPPRPPPRARRRPAAHRRQDGRGDRRGRAGRGRRRARREGCVRWTMGGARGSVAARSQRRPLQLDPPPPPPPSPHRLNGRLPPGHPRCRGRRGCAGHRGRGAGALRRWGEGGLVIMDEVQAR